MEDDSVNIGVTNMGCPAGDIENDVLAHGHSEVVQGCFFFGWGGVGVGTGLGCKMLLTKAHMLTFNINLRLVWACALPLELSILYLQEHEV